MATCFGCSCSHLQASLKKNKNLMGIDWLICIWVRALTVPMHLGRNWRALCAPYQFMGALLLCWRSRWLPDILLMSSGSKKKEPRYTCLSEAKDSHLYRMWAEVSSSAPHLLHSGLSSSPSRQRCLLRVLRPVRRPVIALDEALLKDRNLALAPSQGPKINSWACLHGIINECFYLYFRVDQAS